MKSPCKALYVLLGIFLGEVLQKIEGQQKNIFTPVV